MSYENKNPFVYPDPKNNMLNTCGYDGWSYDEKDDEEDNKEENNMYGKYENFVKDITVNNCNYRLSTLYNIRDKTSERIDKFIGWGAERKADKLEEEYNTICDVVDVLIDFRRHHECFNEGDVEYEMN